MYDISKIKDVIRAYKTKNETNLTINQILKIFSISKSTLYVWIHKYSDLSETALSDITIKLNVDSRKPRKLTKEGTDFIINFVIKHPDFNARKLVKKIKKTFDININRNYIYYILNKNNITYKKVEKNSYPYGKTKFIKNTKIVKRLVDNCGNKFTAIDETSIYLGTAKNYGWSKKGTRAIVKSNFNRKNKYSLCQAISNDGIIAQKIIKNSFNTVKFNDFVINDVIPNMTNKAILMDGCSIHKSKILDEKLKEKNITKIINVPYSPQFNPIEFTFNTLKNKIKNNNINTYAELIALIYAHQKETNINGFHNYYKHTYNNPVSAIE